MLAVLLVPGTVAALTLRHSLPVTQAVGLQKRATARLHRARSVTHTVQDRCEPSPKPLPCDGDEAKRDKAFYRAYPRKN